jgi:hypothetical protein
MIPTIDLFFAFALHFPATIQAAEFNTEYAWSLSVVMAVMIPFAQKCEWAGYVTIPLLVFFTATGVCAIFIFFQDLQKGIMIETNLPMYSAISMMQVGYVSRRFFH